MTVSPLSGYNVRCDLCDTVTRQETPSPYTLLIFPPSQFSFTGDYKTHTGIEKHLCQKCIDNHPTFVKLLQPAKIKAQKQ